MERIAVTYKDNEVFQHFGHSEEFKIYDVEDGVIKSSTVVNSSGQGHGALSGFLKENGVNVLICGGIGGGARQALNLEGIRLYPGVTGNADEAVEAFLNNTLEYNPDTVCSHHHGEEGHSCGEDKYGCAGA